MNTSNNLKPMTDLQIRFVPRAGITPELDREIDALDKLAFADEVIDDPDFNSIQWAGHDWLALGYVNGELVTQLCLPIREILVGAEKVRVAGVGGMATLPQHWHKGYGTALLSATEIFMRDELRVSFGLLVCADETQPFYQLSRWQKVADSLYFTQDNVRRPLQTCVMILQLTNQTWQPGEIDLLGLPW
jgi:GNAT superfamily N-acetyltransferase